MTPTPNLRPQRMAMSTFDAWRLTNNGLAQSHVVTGETLVDITAEIATEAHHGDTFLIVETWALDTHSMLHTFRVRRGRPVAFVGRRKVFSYTVDRLFSVAVSAFDPVLPWRCVPGADRVGISNVIQARS